MNATPTARNILVMAAWFGLLAGIVEGGLLFAIQEFWRGMHVGVQILWISPALDLLLFGVVGLVLVGVSWYLQPNMALRLAAFAFAFLTVLSWIAVAFTGRLKLYALFLLSAGLATLYMRWFVARGHDLLAFQRATLRWVVLGAVLILVGVEGGRRARERVAVAVLPALRAGAPNVLVIVIDALRADHVSGLGYHRATTPNLDLLASDGVLFEKAFATSSYSLASHASLVTGQYPHVHRAQWDAPRELRECECPNLVVQLRELGYRTGAFSANTFWFTHEYGFGRGFLRFDDYFHSVTDMAIRTLYGRAFEHLILPRIGVEDLPSRKWAPDINRSLLHWIDRDPEKPFFALLNYFDAHDPYLPPQPYRAKFSRFENPGGVINQYVRTRGIDWDLPADELEGEIDAYDGAIAYVDDYLGRLLQALRDRGIGDNTLIVITSDHGQAFGDHGLYLHGNSLYREVIHVPLIIWQPRHVRAGIRVSRPVTNAAIAATVLTLIGADVPVNVEPSLTRLWMDPEAAVDWPPPLSELVRQPWGLDRFPSSHGEMKSLVGDRWHCIAHETFGTEIYDWDADPGETNNLGDHESMRDVVADCHRRLLDRVTVPWLEPVGSG
jgi:arylsulfatase A-like enzyme